MWRSPIYEKHFFRSKMPEKPVFWHFLEILQLVFSDFLHKMDIRIAQNMAESDFWEKIFPVENTGNIPEIAGKTRFLAFSRDFTISFFWFFCTKMCIRNAQNMVESNFREKFFPAENAGNIPDFAHFPQTFSVHFVVFSHKNINDIAFSFVRSFVCSFFRSFIRSFVLSLVRFSGSYPLMPIFALSFLTFIIR